MTVAESQRELFEKQLVACREDLSRFDRGKNPLAVFVHNDEVYPFFDTRDRPTFGEPDSEFIWFCKHTGWAGERVGFDAINHLWVLKKSRRLAG